MKDLSRDKTELEAKTLKDVLGTIRLIENHLSDLIAIGEKIKDPEEFKKAWKDTKYCQECIVFHGAEVAGYGRECIRAVCSNEKTWKQLRNLGSELYDYFELLKQIEDYTETVFWNANNFVTAFRAIRNQLVDEKTPGTEELIK